MNRILSLSALCFIASTAWGYKYVGAGTPGETAGSHAQPALRAAACAPATGLRDLEWNNVRALIETGGSLWQDRATSQASYEVPKGGGISSLYAGALWMGGISPDQQLKLAALTFRGRGNDYWTGPLTNDGSAEIDAEVCNQYDEFFVSTRSDAQRHRQYFDAVAGGTVDEEFPDGYAMPSYFRDYPAHGNTEANQDYYLAPFKDYDGDGFYSPDNGDYPWYDFLQEIDCKNRKREDIVPLYGDRNFYWIFNDKGNVHSESQGEPIGMEIRAQAFAFSTNDEVNNMTFHNYVLINQGTQTLANTYFGVWVDADVGTATDDYVGCDVQRGLGYSYNGDAVDEPSSSSQGYGENPPAVGIDFFEGPYQDADSIDNPLTSNFSNAIDSLGIPYEGIGIGYGDGIVDNERFGMRRFVYYNNSGNQINGEPSTPLHFYNYMNGIWKNGQKMAYGGDGVSAATGANLDIEADYMFPGDTDPFNWGTGGTTVEPWTEVTSGNPPADRRFIQAAGPFTLEPGDYNNITMGVVWARATAGDPEESVKLMRIADDKAQALFDNCFEIVSGPDAPDVTVQELENELILYLTNDNPLSNNYQEDYLQFDPGIPKFDINGELYDSLSRSYFFEGYQIYQLANSEVSPADLDDIDQARLIFQCDVANDIDVVVNYVQDNDMGLPVPTLMANGNNEGVSHSFQVTKDAFAQGDNALINHKTYYFMALAYGYNNYEEYDPNTGSGQDVQYKASRKAAVGSIRVYSGTPHKPTPESGGLIQAAAYGDGVTLTRLEGQGNGLNDVALTVESEAALVASGNGKLAEVTYAGGSGPVSVRVVDPLSVPNAQFELRVLGEAGDLDEGEDVEWVLTNTTMLDTAVTSSDSAKAIVTRDRTIDVLNEQLILQWGLGVTVHQTVYPSGTDVATVLGSSITFSNPQEPWLLGLPDGEGFTEDNWIRSGTQEGDDESAYELVYNDLMDEDEVYEGFLGGTWAPYSVVSYTEANVEDPASGTTYEFTPLYAPTRGDLIRLQQWNTPESTTSIDVVFTSDTDKWTRCPVLEMQPNNVLAENATGASGSIEKMNLRRHASVDKKGRTVGEGGNASEANLTSNVGMGWFPGYAIDLSTGERLNMAFGEDSWLSADNGKDMIWNPSPNARYSGGQHWIYVFKNGQAASGTENRMRAYDKGAFLMEQLLDPNISSERRAFRDCAWVGSALSNADFPMLPVEEGLIPNETRVSLRVARPYDKYSSTVVNTNNVDNAKNNWDPLYTFSTEDVATRVNEVTVLEEMLEEINVVPNPYYAYSQYETNKLDNRVKIVNLPEVCTVRIYNLSGTLIRTYDKADPLTFVDWDLKNEANVPIAGGVYIIHIDVPG
ncbi:MAG: T9SS C-terminal target domain-containing protein, partial [Bacteroidota bacterium]|nr:T9SS C-terminal target domain-containing protein [Bacteroidota bacterium]